MWYMLLFRGVKLIMQTDFFHIFNNLLNIQDYNIVVLVQLSFLWSSPCLTGLWVALTFTRHAFHAYIFQDEDLTLMHKLDGDNNNTIETCKIKMYIDSNLFTIHAILQCKRN